MSCGSKPSAVQRWIVDEDVETNVRQKITQHSDDKAGWQLDYAQIKYWLHHCRTCHLGTCSRPETLLKIDNLLLIDVQRHCLVEAGLQCDYVALSYGCGKRIGFDQSPIDLIGMKILQGEGILSRVELPTTIRDAMHLVAKIGERYLWCDYLCIIAHDHSSKQRQIRRMDKIYNQAILTIVALSGANGHEPLPGVRRSSRDSICRGLQFDKKRMIHDDNKDASASRPRMSMRVFPPALSVLREQSSYETRG